VSGVARAVLLALMSAALAGCANETREVRPTAPPVRRPTLPSKVPPSPASNTDPCAMRLHDVCGALLLYYFTYQRLPNALDELNEFPGAEAQIPMVCPATNRPYEYTADGITIPERRQRIIVHDPSPAHEGRRWAITIDEPADGQPLVAKVLSLPESFFLLRPPQ
jgi:hypothetical protein